MTESAVVTRTTPLTWVRLQAEKSVPGALVALALTLPAWRYRLMWHTGPEGVYFELRDGFLYLSDLPALIAIAAWLMTPWWRRASRLPRWLVAALAALATLATVSAAWAPLRSFALYQSARLWLLFGLFLVVATTREARGALAWGLLISGAIQGVIGLAQFSLQHTLGLRDLGEIVMRPDWPGASVITLNGVPTLRAYGLTQHPNLLGGVEMVATLIGAGLALGARSGTAQGTPRPGDRVAAVLAAPQPQRAEDGATSPLDPARPGHRGATVRPTALAVAAFALTGACFTGLLLTFSRAAWLGTMVGGATMLLLLSRAATRGRVAWRNAVALLGVLAAIGAVFVATQWPLLRPRLGLAWEGVEVRSADERAGLEQGAWELIRERPWVGVGYGNFSMALWLRKPAALEAYPVYQPVHRAPLLAVAELGAAGGLLWLVLALGPWIAMRRRHSREAAPPPSPAAGKGAARSRVLLRQDDGGHAQGLAAGVAASLAALTIVSLFDFYPWFSQQGRLLAWILWGLWAQSMWRPSDGRRTVR